MAAVDRGVLSDGLQTTVFPATRAPTIIPVGNAKGKLNGPMTPKTPYGTRTSKVSSAGEDFIG